jgi:hypothetical protein
MRHMSRWILCLAPVVSGCDAGRAVSPSAPTVTSAPPIVSTSPHSYRNANWLTPDMFSPIAVGDAIEQRVTLQDPVCHPAYPHHCQFYRYVAARDGVLEVAMVWKSVQTYPLDIDVTDPDSMTWDVTFVAPNERRVQLRVKAGNIYWVSIWSANAPGEPFLLTASLQAD